MQEQVCYTVTETRVEKVRISKAAKERQERLIDQGKCLACEEQHLDGERVTRGQCRSCYNASAYAIKSGKYTNAQLIKAGVLLPSSSGGRKPASAYAQRLAEGTI